MKINLSYLVVSLIYISIMGATGFISGKMGFNHSTFEYWSLLSLVTGTYLIGGINNK